MNRVAFADVSTSDLVVDCVYEGGSAGNRGDDPISKILSVGNAGGFRFMGSPTNRQVRALALYSSMSDADWPDALDIRTGIFTYYGDNKAPGRELHDTPRKGNLALHHMFQDALSIEGRRAIPPIFLFQKAGRGADVMFRGLLVPGARGTAVDESLVAVWRSNRDQRFQNYRAKFTVLDVSRVDREWLNAVEAGEGAKDLEPLELRRWRQSGVAAPLMAPRPTEYRTRDEQLPATATDSAILEEIRGHFAERPHDFEHCAAEIWCLLAPATEELQVTRQTRDGGRDAVGQYRLGPAADQIRIDFALEAKCYSPTNSVGVRDASRLISRLRYRNFGVLVTTSYVNQQAYREIRDDGHPVVIVSGRDIVDVLRSVGITTKSAAARWVREKFPPNSGERVDFVYGDAVIRLGRGV